MERITHRSFSNGEVQSLGFIDDEILEIRVGIAMPGKYDFGTAGKTGEIIQVIHGAIIINGKRYDYDSMLVMIKPGENITFEVKQPSAYKCIIAH